MTGEQITFFPEGVSDSHVAQLLAILATHGWQTRKQLVERTGWSEREVRAVVELAGSQVVRGQSGFKLTSQITRDDLPIAVQAAQAAISQGKKMIRYGLALRRRIREVVG